MVPGQRLHEDVYEEAVDDVEGAEHDDEDVEGPKQPPSPTDRGHRRREGAPVRTSDRPEERRECFPDAAVEQVEVPHIVLALHARKGRFVARGRRPRHEAVGRPLHVPDDALHQDDAHREDHNEEQHQRPEEGGEHAPHVEDDLLHGRRVLERPEGLHRLGRPRYPQDPNEGQLEARRGELHDGEQQGHDVEAVPEPVSAQKVCTPIRDEVDQDLDE
mmetsp:Transcript_34064/g.96750  ORF Transcript_34064/g.96750 Transcript_34064/m.96750 type:complete len:217 (+) Transcript_34064:155-805(+)